jgi:ABC-2 type transport system permease protein
MEIFSKILKNKLWWVWLSLLFVAVIYLASLSHLRLDLTKEKRFSLSSSTKRVLKELDEPVTIDV